MATPADAACRRVRQRGDDPHDNPVVMEEAPVPLIVRVLAGNSVTSATILACISTADVNPLRRTHPVVATVVAAVPWADTSTHIVDVVRWRAALPAVVGGSVKVLPELESLLTAAAGALAGVRCLYLVNHWGITDAVLLRLPPSLRVLKVDSSKLTGGASFAHLTALTTLDCSGTKAVCAGVDRLPPSLCTLHIDWCDLPPTADFRHLCVLQHLSHMSMQLITDTAVASLPRGLQTLTVCNMCIADDDRDLHALWAALPPRLVEFDATYCRLLPPAASFAHLQALRTLTASKTHLGDASLASLPPSLVSLHTGMVDCRRLTSAAV